MVDVISSYHSKHDNGFLVIAIALGRYYIYNGIFKKEKNAIRVSKQVNERRSIDAKHWIQQS